LQQMELSLLSHYDYEACANGYSFRTTSGNTYIISFIEYNLIPQAVNSRLYMFNIDRTDESNHDNGEDNMVRNTIFHILHNFFENFTNAMITVCDSTDGRQDARFRLFSRWFDEIHDDTIARSEASFYIDDVKTYASLFYCKNNIDAAVLAKGFDALVEVNFYH